MDSNNIPLKSYILASSIQKAVHEQPYEDTTVLRAKEILGDKYTTEEVEVKGRKMKRFEFVGE